MIFYSSSRRKFSKVPFMRNHRQPEIWTGTHAHSLLMMFAKQSPRRSVTWEHLCSQLRDNNYLFFQFLGFVIANANALKSLRAYVRRLLRWSFLAFLTRWRVDRVNVQPKYFHIIYLYNIKSKPRNNRKIYTLRVRIKYKESHFASHAF